MSFQYLYFYYRFKKRKSVLQTATVMQHCTCKEFIFLFARCCAYNQHHRAHLRVSSDIVACSVSHPFHNPSAALLNICVKTYWKEAERENKRQISAEPSVTPRVIRATVYFTHRLQMGPEAKWSSFKGFAEKSHQHTHISKPSQICFAHTCTQRSAGHLVSETTTKPHGLLILMHSEKQRLCFVMEVR